MQYDFQTVASESQERTLLWGDLPADHEAASRVRVHCQREHWPNRTNRELPRPDGSLDPSFEAGNALVASYGGPLVIDAITVQADSKVLVGGPGLRRFNVDGSPDSAFNSNGLSGEASAIRVTAGRENRDWRRLHPNSA